MCSGVEVRLSVCSRVGGMATRADTDPRPAGMDWGAQVTRRTG